MVRLVEISDGQWTRPDQVKRIEVRDTADTRFRVIVTYDDGESIFWTYTDGRKAAGRAAHIAATINKEMVS